MKTPSDLAGLNDKALLRYANRVVGERQIRSAKDLKVREPGIHRELRERSFRGRVLDEGLRFQDVDDAGVVRLAKSVIRERGIRSASALVSE